MPGFCFVSFSCEKKNFLYKKKIVAITNKERKKNFTTRCLHLFFCNKIAFRWTKKKLDVKSEFQQKKRKKQFTDLSISSIFWLTSIDLHQYTHQHTHTSDDQTNRFFCRFIERKKNQLTTNSFRSFHSNILGWRCLSLWKNQREREREKEKKSNGKKLSKWIFNVEERNKKKFQFISINQTIEKNLSLFLLFIKHQTPEYIEYSFVVRHFIGNAKNHHHHHYQEKKIFPTLSENIFVFFLFA